MKTAVKEQWETHISNWQQTNLNITDYCKENNISRQSFYKWKALIIPQHCKENIEPKISNSSSEFVPLQVSSNELKENGEVIKLSFTSAKGDTLLLESKDLNLVVNICELLRG